MTRELVIIEMAIGGEPVTMQSCSACDLRLWRNPAGTIPLAEVLHEVARRPK